jgi:hypothetical protein
MQAVCPVCRTSCEQASTGHRFLYECPRCGTFALSGTARAVLSHQFEQDPDRRSIMSHLLRRMQHSDETPVEVCETDLVSFWLEELPSPQRQADNLILWMGDTQRTPDRPAQTTVPFLEATIGAAISEKPFAGWFWLSKQLEPRKLFDIEKGKRTFRVHSDDVGLGTLRRAQKNAIRKPHRIYGNEVR